jgi:hypothetical protein
VGIPVVEAIIVVYHKCSEKACEAKNILKKEVFWGWGWVGGMVASGFSMAVGEHRLFTNTTDVVVFHIDFSRLSPD